MQSFIRIGGIFSLLLCSALVTQAQTINNNFADAWTLSGSIVSTNGSNANQNKEPGEPAHAGNGGARSVWFNWTAPKDSQVRLDTVGTTIDTLLAVYTGNAVNALTPVASNNGAGVNESRLEFLATQGVTYRIAVDVFNQFPQFPQFQPQGGNYVLNLRTLASVKITTPIDNNVVYLGTPVPIAVDAEVVNMSVTRVDIYQDGNLIATDPSLPYQHTIASPSLGTSALYAVAVDNLGLSWTSAVVRVPVLDLGVTIVSPTDGTVFSTVNSVSVSVQASLPSGSITNVEFFVDDQKFAEDGTVPYRGIWSGVLGGIHRLVAIGQDGGGISYTSSPVTISVPRRLVVPGAVWKYLDDGSDQGANWMAPGYDDSSWASGPAELGYGDGNEATVVGFGPVPTEKFVTTYFRHSFSVRHVTNYLNLNFGVKRDDGAILYLNGVEVQRFNMPSGNVDYQTRGFAASDDGTVFYPASAPATSLVEGLNVLAVEVHQAAVDGDDLSFDLQLFGSLHARNEPPAIDITSPANLDSFLFPPSITLVASASDSDGDVARVDFYADNTLLGADSDSPYSVTWNNPTVGWHSLRAFATDDLDTAAGSEPITVVVYDPQGTPLSLITQPTDGLVVQGPVDFNVTADAAALAGVADVQFLANGVAIGSDAASPYGITWSAPFGTNRLTAITTDVNGKRGTSAVVTVTVTIPPTNTVAPVLVSRIPAPGATVSSLPTVRVTFSESVSGVDAGDLLVNGVPAIGMTSSRNIYLFNVEQPIEGVVTITWAAGHGIQDFGYPSPLPFNENGAGASWTFNLVDRTPPEILSVEPAPGAVLTNLSQVTVTFSERMSGVEPADFLVNGAPAFGLSVAGSAYTFSFSQPASGTVNITWAAGNGIGDLANPANPFNSIAAGATWNYTLDARKIIVQPNETWRFVKGTAEASAPANAWRQPAFDDSSWTASRAPFYYGDPYNTPANPGTLLDDMAENYSSVFLRHTFTLDNAGAITNLFISAQSDDGFIAWINGLEVARSATMPAGPVAYNGTAAGSANEPNNSGAAYISYSLPNPGLYLVDGPNVLAVHAFNQSINSSDFGFNAQIYTFLSDPQFVAPRVTGVTPSAGVVFHFTNLTVRFLEPVTGVDAGDLLLNGVPATSVSGGTSNSTYVFSFAQPAYGPVAVTWSADASIVDFDSPPKPFVTTDAGANFQFSLLNPDTPTIASQSPLGGATLNDLTQLSLTFSEPVVGVTAGSLLLNGVPATSVSGSGANYTFSFTQPDYGVVSVGIAASHTIADLGVPPTPFDVTREGGSWTYTLVDKTPPAIASLIPVAGTQVVNLTQVTVNFSEAVAGVNASDLLVNGLPATSVSGSFGNYTFSFPQPNATVVNFTWATAHGIRDLAPIPNSFDPNGPGATWSYTTFDNVAPVQTALNPPAGATVRSLSQISITFSENVVGVSTNDLLVNDRAALQVTGTGAGPYIFNYLPPSNGVVQVRWDAASGISDLAAPPNSFASGSWTYTLDPDATFAGKVIINELMFNPAGGRTSDEWIELRNVSSSPVNLAGWQFTRGVNYTLPNVTLEAGGFLVVAANIAAFQAKYPAVANVVGGWTGSLANSDETLELTTTLGETANRVHYATQGDWARRERGNGSAPVESIVRNGNTATVSVFGHGFTGGDQVQISGADQPEYNGRFGINNVGSSTFGINVTGNPPSPATGNIIARQVVDDGFTGWSWFSAADGFGHSLELINALMPNGSGQNWSSSSSPGGTPGQPNSIESGDIAPLLSDVTHFPLVPRSTESVSITARVADESSSGVASVTLFYRNHTAASPGPFFSRPMLDDGASGDGQSRDGLYGTVLPAAANGTIIEFYVQATDTGARSRTWPAPTWDTDNTFAQLANALYQVDDEVISNPMPAMRIIMTGTERSVFPASSRNSDAESNVTLVSDDGDGVKVRYLGGVRIRGAGSRNQPIPNNRLNIPNDNRWNGYSAVNLNGLYVHSQIMGASMAHKAGLPSASARIIQYRINGVNPAPLTAPGGGGGGGAGYGSFIMVEPVNGDLAQNLFPDDGGGNVYRASTGNHNADLSYQGTNINNYLGRGYFKTSNGSENDWTDMSNLTFALNQVVNEADYIQAISTNMNVEYWMRYFAVGTLMSFTETSMFNGRGDDYAMYRGEKDPRFVAIGHDFDTVFGQGDTVNAYSTQTNSSIYIMLNPPNVGGGGFGGNPPNMPVLRRLMNNPLSAPLFFSELKRLTDTVFSPESISTTMDQMLTGWGNGPSTVTINAMKNHAINRRANVVAQIPLTLTVNNSLPITSGFPYTTTPNVTLFGTSHAIDTRKVLVNGAVADRSYWEARWTNVVTLRPGINRVLVQSLNSNDVEFARATVDIWYDNGASQNVSGPLTSDAVWTAANGPYQVTSSVTVNSGVTLTIQPGTTVYFAAGANLNIANGGRLLAEGADNSRIRFSAIPGSPNWGGIVVNGAVGSPETRIAHAHITGNNSTAIRVTAGTVFLDHLSFGSTTVRCLDLDDASFVVQDCVFPSGTAAFEPIHGSQGIRADGRGIFLRNFIGKTVGYNDSIDFTGGNRPGPILQIINNVFLGSDDDLLDLDSTDAWIEGNIFLHTHRNGSPDSASAISGGADNADTSQITAIGNLFFDVDHAANAKQGNFYTMINNTIVHQTKIGSEDTNTAVVILADMNEQGTFTAQGAGMYLEGNIIYDAENLTRHVTTALVTFTNNIIHQLTGAPWTGPGGNNSTADPLLKRIPDFSETTNFNSWAAAQVMWDYFSLQPGSPAAGMGPNGRDQGIALQPSNSSTPQPALGLSISGEPAVVTSQNSATLHVGVLRTGDGIPTAGFPNGSGFSHYRWRLDGGAWSAETPISTPISLSGLSSGPHFVEAVGRNDAGFYQDDAVFGSSASISVSRTWTVNPGASPLRLNEVLAANSGAFNHLGTTPDAIELFNASDIALNLAGVRLTDDAQAPDKFIFPAGATIPARGYLVVFANNPDGTAGHHLGFNLSQGGETLYVYDSASRGGALLDKIKFGLQLTDLSIGRLVDGSWALNQQTLGTANRAAQLGDPRALRINEWLAIGIAPFDNDFIELYNGGPLPVSLSGLFLTDELIGDLARHEMPALTFIGGFGYQRLIADGNRSAGADHLNFNLNGDFGEIGLLLPDLSWIDSVYYQGQRLNISQGRSPNGGNALVFFETPTPGAPNPLITLTPQGGALVINEVLADNASLAENGRTPDWIELYNGTTNTINLADLSLTDDTLQPRRFVFGPGTTLAPAAYLRVLCDPGSIVTGPLVNTNFALKATGGGVYLFDALSNGGSLLSSVIYGIQTADLTIGRVPDGSASWVLNTPTPSAANASITTLGSVASLKVNEWLADPLPGDDDWIEIYNSGTLPVAIGGLHLTDDLNNRTKHQIAALSFLGTGTNAFLRFLADGNTGSGADHVGFSLRGAGEAVGISDTAGVLIDGYAFGPQESGVSEGRFSDGSTNVVRFPGTDSPGRSNWRQLTTIAISEVLTHSDSPLEDAIELQNLTGSPIDVSGWWLSDDDGFLRKYQIPSATVIPANGFTVIYETGFSNPEQSTVPFSLSSRGDEVVLSASANNALTGYRARVDFGAQLNGVSFGRYLTSDDRAEFVALNARTFGVDDPGSVEEFRTGTGAANSAPRVGPVVISEIMYHPPDIGTTDNTQDEFIELHNITTAPVPLYDPLNPANVWRLRDAVDFDFAPDTTIAPGDYLIVVSFDPANNPTALAEFRVRYNIASGTRITGPYSGKLANDTDDLELRRPDPPNLGDVPYVLVERVRYSDTAPWPKEADGTSFSLQRVSDTGFGNDPANWIADVPTPGPASSSLDTDNDGLPNDWEIQYGLDPFNPLDAALDSDGDGLTNLQEHQIGSNPRDAQSGVRITSIALSVNAGNVVLTFTAFANYSYTVESASTLSGPWTPFQDVAAVAATQVMQLTVPANGSAKFFRLRTPWRFTEPATLRVDSIQALPGNQAKLSFTAAADKACAVEYRANLNSGSWNAVTNFPAGASRLIEVTLPRTGTGGFYRLRTP